MQTTEGFTNDVQNHTESFYGADERPVKRRRQSFNTKPALVADVNMRFYEAL